MYYCKECGLEVAITPSGEKIKACSCNAPIVAEMKAEADGLGGIEN